ncbi:MAG: lysophospholipid acyltransferase family protein [bacterium]|nr:lysophospholipid acyltransferase family protein [bacterium]
MLKIPVRVCKGMYLGLLFLAFGLFLIMENIAVLPVLRVIGVFSAPEKSRLQNLNRSLFWLWFRLLKIGGLLEVRPPAGTPCEGPSVIVANHPGLFDVLVLIRVIPRMSVMAKRSLGLSIGMKYIMSASGYVASPELSNPGSAIHSLKAVKEILGQGYRFMLFPEGTRSPKGGMSHFHPGAFRIAQMAGVPVQPVIIRNSPPFLPKEDHWYYPPFERSVLELEFLEPLPPPEKSQAQPAALQLERRFRRELGLPEEEDPPARGRENQS